MKQNSVFVLDKERNPLMPCHPARARRLLSSGRASVFRRYPFTIILHDRALAESEVQDVQVKIDPGGKQTGMALVANDVVIWAAELKHRGAVVHGKMEGRAALRSNRRNRKTRYRPARWSNRARPKGWLPPSLRSRIDNVMTWVARLSGYAPVSQISMELVKFDTQLMENAEVSGVEYQQGELAGYEVREYLLEKFGRQCVYCGAKDVALEIEHIVPKSRGGSNRASNLTLACRPCNQTKGNQTASEYGHPKVQAQAKLPLRDASAVNASRWALWRKLSEIGMPLETGTGGRTKFNRIFQKYPKAHWIDAACVGVSGQAVQLDPDMQVLSIKATGRGTRQMCQTNKYGFPIKHRGRKRRVHDFQTGDIAAATIPTGKYAGYHVGKVTIRQAGSFKINGLFVNPKYLRRLQRTDGYEYKHAGALCSSVIGLPNP